MDFFLNLLFASELHAAKHALSLGPTHAGAAREWHAGSEGWSGVLPAAVRAFRHGEAADSTWEGRAMAEFAEIVVLPRLADR